MKLRRTSNNIERRIKKLNEAVTDLPSDAHRYFKSITPIDTGNARANTDLRNTSIVADYDYSIRLNTGYSRQAPDGMTDPTIEYIRSILRKL